MFSLNSSIPNNVYTEKDQSFVFDLSEGSQMHISNSIINLIHSRVFHNLRTVFNRKVETFFARHFDQQLEAIVEEK